MADNNKNSRDGRSVLLLGNIGMTPELVDALDKHRKEQYFEMSWSKFLFTILLDYAREHGWLLKAPASSTKKA